MRRAGTLALIAAVAVVAAATGYQRLAAGRGSVHYITRPVTFADIVSTVTETGTVNPVDEVQVGTQVSGTIATLSVDYNSKVTKGEVLATLDPATFRAAVAEDSANLDAAQATASAAASGILQAQASVRSAVATLQQQQANLQSALANAAKATAQLALDILTVQRDASLLQQGYIPQNQMDTDRTAADGDAQTYKAARDAVGAAQAQLAAAQAQLRSAQQQVQTAQSQAAAAQHQVAAAQAQLQTAQYNLSQTVIRSPVDGVVMARNVSVGETVAASFQTPTLFTIATSLTNLQVDTSVDESDVGNVRAGESAQITTTAFPDVTFPGTVQQVRVNPTVTNNVVTYDAVVIVHDTSGRLLPGMTAQVVIDTGRATHVLAAPLSALLYRPLPTRAGAASGAAVSAGLIQNGTGPQSEQEGPPVAGAPGSRVVVWVLRNGRPVPISITIGLSDNKNVQITSGSLRDGDSVIIAQIQGRGRNGSPTPVGAPGGAGSR